MRRAGYERQCLGMDSFILRCGICVRGGSWDFNRDLARVAYRLRSNPDNSNNYVGFRVVSPVF